MKKFTFSSAIVLLLAALGAGVWLVSRDSGSGSERAEARLGARETLERHLAEGRGVAAADWVRGGTVGGGGETGSYASFSVAGLTGREAVAYLVRLADGAWYLVSLTEGPPQCAAVEKYGFPSAMISDCRVGEAQTVAEALAAAIGGADVSGVRLVGQITLPPDPSCDCVLLTSGGASVRLSISASTLAAAGISFGDTVVISGGLGGDLSVDASSVIRSSEDGTPDAIVAAQKSSSGGATSSTSGNTTTTSSETKKKTESTTAKEPAAVTVGTGVTTGGGSLGTVLSVPGFPDWSPRRRYKTAWYTNPLDLDASSAGVPTLGD